MSIELTTLSFKVDTKELDNAVTKVGELGEAVSKVNTPLSELAKNSKGAAKGAADFSASAGKAGKGAKELADNTDAVDAKLQKLRDQLGFLRNDLNMSETGFSKMQAGVMASMKAIGASDAQLKQFATTFDQFNKIMGEQALDKSVAGLNMLNRQMREFQMTNELAAKGFNLTSTQVKQLARDIEALQQQNQEFGRSATFGVDELTKKYVSAANSVNQYIAAAKESEQAAKREAQAAIESAKATDANNAAIARQYELVRQSAWKEYAAGVGQTSNEIKALSSYYNNLQKETEQANAAIEKQFGMLRSSAWKEYSNSVGQTSDEMKKLNNYFREQEKAASDLEAQRFKALGVEQQVATTKKQIIDEATRSEQYLIKETEKLIFVNEKLAQGFSTASANALFKYQEALQKTGRTADQVQKELADLGVELMKKQGTSPISSMRKDIQQLDQSVNHLARNIGVQFTDIFVSLANGQSIFQVATQQGGQLADAFLLAGISGGKMTDQLVDGAKVIYNSYKVLLSAFLDLSGRAIMGAGNAIVDFGSKVTGTNAILNTSRSIIESFGGDSEKFISIVDKMGASFRVAAGVGVGLLVAGFVSMGVAMVQVLKEQQALNLAINTTGASLGLTKDSAIELTRSLSDIGVNTTNATAVLTELAKGGTLSAESFEYVAEAADKMQKYAGVSIDKTVADFNKLAKEPAKNLAELAGKTGYVTEETLRYIQALEDEGKQIEAVQAATEAMAEAKIKAAESAYASASPLIQLWIDIKSAVSDAWSEFKDATSQGEGLASIIRVAWETVAVIVSEVWYVLKMTGKEIGGIAAMISRVLVGDFAGAKTIWNSMGEDAKKAREQQDATVKSIIEGVKVVQDAGAKERQENARSAASFEEKEKARKKALEESKRAAEKAANELAKYISKIEEKIRDLSISTQAEWNKMFTASDDLTKSQKMMLDIIDDPLFKSLPDREKERHLAVLAQNHALEVQISLEKERLEVLRKIWQGTVDAQTKADNFAMDEFANYEEQKRILESNNKDLVFRESLIGKTAQEQKNLTRQYEAQKKIASAQLDLEKKKAAAQEKFAGAADKAQLEELKQLYETEYAEKVKLINKEIAIQAAEDMVEAFNQMRDGITDALVTAIMEGGKAGGKKLFDSLKNILRQKLTIAIQAQVNTVMNSGGSGKPGSPGTIGGLTGGLADAYSLWMGGSYSQSLYSGVGSVMNFAAENGMTALNQFANSVYGGVQAVDTFFESVGGLDGAMGYLSAFNNLLEGNYGSAIGAAIGTYILPGIGTVIGEFLGSFADGLFGDAGTAHTGGVGSYSATGGTSYGMRSNVVKGYTGGVAFGADAYSEQTAKGSAELAKGMVTLLDSFAQTFGKEVGYYVGTGFADDSSGDGAWGGLLVKLGDKIIKDWGRGVDKWPGREFANGQAGQEQYLAAVAKETRDIMKTIAPDWAKSILDSLGNDVTFESLQQALALISQINTAFKQLADIFPIFNNLAGTAQTQLLQFFGGVEGLTNALGGYYANFYSEQEKVARQTALLTEAFDSLGYTLPTSKAAFRSLVESLDLTTEEGRKTFAGLMQLQQPFSDLNSVIQELSSTVQDEVRRLRGLLSVDSTNSSAALQAQFTTLTAQARAGDATALERLPEISQAIEQAAMLTAVTAADVARVRGWLAASMSDTLGVLGMQVPQFAVGTNYVPQDTLAVVHKGEAIVPKAYNPAANGMSNNSDMVAELRSLKEEVVMLRAETRATVSNTSKTAKLLDRAMPDGQSIQVTTVA